MKRYKSVLIVAAFSFLEIVLLLLLFSPAFETNDDVIMMMISSGFLSGQESNALIFTSFIIGGMLKFFYQTFPSINWYILYQYGYIFLSIFFINFLFFKKFNSKFNINLIFIFCLIAPAIVSIQYTFTAFLVGAGASLVFWHAVLNEKRNLLVLSFFLFVITYWVRWHVFLYIAFFNLPIAVFYILKSKRYKYYYFFFAALFSYFLMQHKIDIKYYETNYSHGEVYEYQNAIDIIVNGPNKITGNLLKENGFFLEDFELLETWFWIDSGVFENEKIISLSKNASTRWSLMGAAYLIWQTLKFNSLAFIVVFLLVFPIVTFMLKSKGSRSVLYIITITSVFSILYMSFFKRMPYRVLYPISVLTILFLLFFSNFKREHNLFSLAYYGVIFIFALININSISHKNKKNKEDFIKMIEILSNDTKNTFIIRGASAPYEGFFMWGNPKSISNFNLIPTGWETGTPALSLTLAKHSVTNIATAILEKGNFILVGAKIDDLNKFLCFHYGKYIKVNEGLGRINSDKKSWPLYYIVGVLDCKI